MKQQPVSYGGQAVIEGVMMQGGGGYAIACRKEDGSIIYKNGANKKPEERPKIWRLPLFRGVYSFASSMKMGFSCLSWSAMQAGEEEEALTWKEVAFAVVSALVLVILIFVVVPVLIGSWVLPYVGNFGRSLVEGIVRLGIFVAYIAVIAKMPDMARVFQYHGAEHKTIATLEAGEPLTVENARSKSRIHVRCGTSFIIMAFIMMVVIFAFVGNTTSPWLRMLIKIVMMPVVAGIAFEVYRLPLKYPNNPIVKALVAPGLWLQRLTTNEPDDSQLEVAITSMLMVPGFPVGDNPVPKGVYKEGEEPLPSGED